MIFCQSKNGEFSKKRYTTLMLHLNEPNFVSNEDLALSDKIVETEISHPQPHILGKGKITD